MPSPKGDPTYIKNKEKYFMDIAKAVGVASTHPKAPGGCVIVRDREIVGDGRSVYTHSKVEIDCLTYAIACASKNGTPLTGAVVYTTRYPFSASIFQCYLMGIRKIVILAHEWEPFYKDEFRRAARLARELCMAIEPLFETEDERFGVNKAEVKVPDAELYTDNPNHPDEYDPQSIDEINDETTTV